jgi:acyl-coenzyme A synthetase/AMP-(fatty) acid ligase
MASVEGLSHGGEPVPPRFNLARYCLDANARDRGKQQALIVVGGGGAEQRWTFAAFEQAVQRLAGGLRTLGLEPGARVMIRMANDSDYALMFFAAVAAGYVALPSSTQLTEEEADFLLRDSGAALLALSGDLTLSQVPPGVQVIRPDDIASLKAHDPAGDYADTAADDPAFLIYTSGTTGRPKGVLHAQRSVWGRRPMHDGWLGLRENDIMLHAGAFNWTYTLGVGMMDPWARGAGVVLYNGPRDRCIWPRLIERYRATLFAAVPSVYRQLLKYCDLGNHDISSLRHGLTAGEALSPALLDAWKAATGKPLYEALGMSEISTYVSSGPSCETRPGSPGKPQPGRRIAILPVAGGSDPLPAGKVGLLAVHRSDPGLMLGYWQRPEEEEQVFHGDWFTGGDLASLDEDGYLWYQGRGDDVMNALGYRVSPMEVEAVLATHPAVTEVAVTELPVRDDVSVIAAFIVPRDVEEADAGALIAFAHEHLAAYKCPREVIFLESLPRTANGKVLRRALREHAQR